MNKQRDPQLMQGKPDSMNQTVQETLKHQAPKIELLPPALINRIAAGEVVDRPASVIKELVENAIDAGATRIEVAATNGGRTLRVSDNGCGMNLENAPLAFINHATSKIKSLEDLDQIQTLGFRGEALASIASVSKVTCLTRTQEMDRGLKITVNSNAEPEISETGCAQGTSLEVADLFFNTPARLKFLKRPATELGHIEETLQALAIANPNVQFNVSINDKMALKTTGTDNLALTTEEVFGLKKEDIQLLPLKWADPDAGYTVTGLISDPGVTRGQKRWLLTFVNQRVVKCPVLSKAIESAYESMIPKGRYPIGVIFLTLPHTEVDVNVHPTKKEVRYQNSNVIFSAVRTAIQQALSSFSPMALPNSVDGNPTNSMTTNPTSVGWRPSQTLQIHSSGGNSFQRRERFTTGSNSDTYSTSGFSSTGSAPTEHRQAALDFYQPLTSETAEETTQPNQPATVFKVLGQLFNTYILLETVQGLMVVDQHIASERSWFEKLSKTILDETPAIQTLSLPWQITLSPEQVQLISPNLEALEQLGFQCALEQSELRVSGIPILFCDRFKSAEDLLQTLLSQIEETGSAKLSDDHQLSHLIATLSCHSAVRAGDTLTHPQMTLVIQDWLACKLPWTCPHGRPIAHTIPKNELNQFFDRPSLPVNALS